MESLEEHAPPPVPSERAPTPTATGAVAAVGGVGGVGGITNMYPPLMDVLRQFDNPMEPIDLLSLDTPLTYLGDHMNDSCIFSPIEPHILSPHIFLCSPDDNSEDACSPPPPLFPTSPELLPSPPTTPTPLAIPSPAAVRKASSSPLSSPPPPPTPPPSLSPLPTPDSSPFRSLGAVRHHPYQTDASTAIVATKARKKTDLVPLSNPKGCDFCQTSITPMWRRGPNGIATLCNACGLKFAKMQKLHAGSASRARSPSQLEKKISPTNSPVPQRAAEVPDLVPVRPPVARSLADAFDGATQLMYWNP